MAVYDLVSTNRILEIVVDKLIKRKGMMFSFNARLQELEELKGKVIYEPLERCFKYREDFEGKELPETYQCLNYLVLEDVYSDTTPTRVIGWNLWGFTTMENLNFFANYKRTPLDVVSLDGFFVLDRGIYKEVYPRFFEVNQKGEHIPRFYGNIEEVVSDSKMEIQLVNVCEVCAEKHAECFIATSELDIYDYVYLNFYLDYVNEMKTVPKEDLLSSEAQGLFWEQEGRCFYEGQRYYYTMTFTASLDDPCELNFVKLSEA